MKKEFNLTDLVLIENMSKTFEKMNEILRNSEEIIDKTFKKKSQGRILKKSHISNSLCYCSFVLNVFNDDASSIYINFSSNYNGSHNSYVEIYLLLEEKSKYYLKFKSYFEEFKNSGDFCYLKQNNRVAIYNREPLISFIHLDNHFESIENWFMKSLFTLKKLKLLVSKY